MALKFLNKKGWHTGSLRNIENVWKAEQKQEVEQRKLEELRKQIQEEKERSEFRRLQEEAGLVPRQERLEFLYDSGLSVGKPSSDGSGFKSLDALPQATNNEAGVSSSSAKQDAVPGALFEEKQQSANDTWRKLHSDPLLMIRQREQEALARIKNNPVKMAMIRKSVESKKHEDEDSANKKVKRKHRKHSSSKNRSDSEDEDRKHKKKHSSSKHRTDSEDDGRRHRKFDSSKYRSDSEDEDKRHKKHAPSKHQSNSEDDERKHRKHASSKYRSEEDDARGKEKESNKEANRRSSKYKEYTDSRGHRDSERGPRQQKFREGSPLDPREENRQRKSYRDTPKDEQSQVIDERGNRHVSGSQHRRRNVAPKFSEEERAAKLREMQMDAELHEDQRWSRLKKADEDDAREAVRAVAARGKSFLDAAQERVYGAEQGGSSTIEESVRRRSHFLQSRSAAEGNAFRR